MPELSKESRINHVIFEGPTIALRVGVSSGRASPRKRRRTPRVEAFRGLGFG